MKKLILLVVTILAMSAFVVADDWGGFYVGGQAGYNWGNADTTSWHTDPEDTHEFTLNGFEVNCFAGGIFMGYDWAFDSGALVGIEADVNWTTAKDKITRTEEKIYEWGAEVRQKWDTSLRMRAGKQMGGYLLYATGGVAWAKVIIDGFTSWDSEQGTHHEVALTGWTFGAGLEKKLHKNIHARIQYDYSGYGDHDWSLAEPNDVNMGKIKYKNQMLAGGVSFYF